MASAHFAKFDPAEHPGNLYDAFCEFIDAFAYEYEALPGRTPPTGTTDTAAWTELDKRKQLLGRFASRNLQKDFEDEVDEAERPNITFKDTVKKLKDRYQPTQNKTLANYEFHKLKQQSHESFDVFVNRVKQEANSCEFTCASGTCTVKDVMIRDQIIIGTSDNAIRKEALNEQWSLADVQAKGRKMEAAAVGAERIKQEATSNIKKEVADVNRTKPGKYSRKGGKGKKKKKGQCGNCSNNSCTGDEKCFARGRKCFDCNQMNHLQGAKNCKGKEGKEKALRKTGKQSSESGSSNSSSEDEDADVHRVTAHISPARFVAHVRRSRTKSRQKSGIRYQVPVVIKEKVVKMFADTGADISVMSKSLSDELGLPLTKTPMRIKPYGQKKRIRCIGFYVGPVRYKDEIANVAIYVVKGEVEALLSGAASEALGIISFHGDGEVRRSVAEDPSNQVYFSKFPSLFSGVGKMKNYKVKFHIDPNVPPVAHPKRSAPYHLQGKLDKEIERMEKAGVIEDHEGPAPWISNLSLAPKDNGDLRVTVDMREPNKAILDTGLPIPKPEDIRKEFVGCKRFSKLDFKTAFHQLELDEDSRCLTVFHHNGKLKRHTRLTMGAKPASGELNKALRPLFNNVAAAHIIHDDLVIATSTEEEQEAAIIQVLEIIAENNLTLNPDKCLFNRTEIPFWGMIISGEGVRPDPEKVQALREASHPESKSELMSFLCMLQANAEFIPQLSKETVHLRELTQQARKFKWTKKCQEEFERLRELLSDRALLNYFDTQLPTYIIVDAHRSGLSAILAQGDSVEQAKMISCASRATTPVERRYHQLDLEALAVDFGLRRFRQYIVGGPQVVVVTDHKPLVSIFRETRRGSVRTDRIKLRHQDVSYKVIFRPGRENMADFLSRHATPWNDLPEEWKEETKEFEKTIWFLNFSPYSEAVSIPNIIKETEQDKKLQKLIEYVKKGSIPKSAGKEWQRYRGILSNITVSDAGLLLKDDKIILPESLWKLAIDKAHQGGHPGETRMKSRVRSHFWIPDLNKLVQEKVSTCETCQRFTTKTTKEPAAAQKTTGMGWEEVSIDLFGPLPNKKQVLVVQDTMSRFPAATIVSSSAAAPVIKALDKVYNSYGQPQRHRTDNGPPFNSDEFTQYSKEKGIDQVFSYPYHPQGNPCETFMKPLGKAIKAALFNRDSAQQAVDDLLQAYRTTPHPATGIAPGDILFRYGYHADFPRKASTDEEVDAAVDKDREQKRERTENTNASSKRRTADFQPGDQVLLKEYPKQGKFDPLYARDVAEVIQVEDKGVIVRESDGKIKRRHKDDVKRYFQAHPSLPQMYQDEEEYVVPTEAREANENEQAQQAEVATGETVEMEAPAGEAAAPPRPATRPQRQKNLPSHLKDFVLKRVLKGKGGQ